MRYIHELINDAGTAMPLAGCPVKPGGRSRVNILALGDVGATMLIGLRLLGGDVIESIGICDIRRENTERLEMEINQIGYPFEEEDSESRRMPPVSIVDEEELFDCDVMIFCASRGVPPVEKEGSGQIDVHMVQLEANRDIISHYAEMAKKAQYRGLVCVVSDPVDHLAAAFLHMAGLQAWQVQGYGLGVMNRRALYYARRSEKDSCRLYETEGRAYGPHGQDLVIANSIAHYDEEASAELTELAVTANLKVRSLGFKPYIAPALSSAAISILLTLRGQWHYGSLYLGSRERGAFLGIRCRLKPDGWEYEDAQLPDGLYGRIERAYLNLCGVCL